MILLSLKVKKQGGGVCKKTDVNMLGRVRRDLTVCFGVIQLIQTVTAVDPDEPLGGQHFYYSLAPEAANNPNFTLRDNQGRFLRLSERAALSSFVYFVELKQLQRLWTSGGYGGSTIQPASSFCVTSWFTV